VPLEAAPDTAQRIGEFVFTVARDARGRASASFGHLGAVGGPWHSGLGSLIHRYLRLDGGLYPGASGAPLADASGHLIGMASAAFERGYGIVLPLQTLGEVLPQLLAKGRVAQGYLGVSVQPVDLMPGGGRGLLVTALAADGPGAGAGLLLGDIILTLGGRPVDSLESLRAALAQGIDATVEMSLQRAGQPHTLSVHLGERKGCC
jgi:S1-C subfamily serine protease